MDPTAPGWYPDPYGRHERRYWSGLRWSRHVEDGGHRSDDMPDGDSAASHGQPPQLPRRSRVRAPARKLLRPAAHAPRRQRDDPLDPVPPPPMSGPDGPPIGPLTPPPGLAVEADLAFGDGRRRHARGSGRTPAGRGPFALLLAGVVGAAMAFGLFVFVVRSDDGTVGSTGDADRLQSLLVGSMDEKTGNIATDTETSCMADGLLRTVGRDRLTALGVLDGADPVLSLDDAEKHMAVPRAMDCLDDARLLEVLVATWPYDDFGPDTVTCVMQGLLDGLGRERLVYAYTTFLDEDPPALDETLNDEERTVVIAVANQCNQPPAAAPTTNPPSG